jgi:glycosyltransferase involved in cell wall biosynthesis
VSSDPAPTTTVVLPVWDEYVEPAVTESLQSLADQDVAAPVIVVDNASEVPIPDVPGTSVVRSARRLTLGAARNLGLTHVTTPYVVVWDADDVMLPGALAALQHGLEADPKLAAFGLAILEEPSGRRHRWPRPWIARLARAAGLFALVNTVWSLYPTTGATIMRTALVRDAGGYSDAESGEDWALGVSLAFRGSIGWSEQPGRIYRIHDQSVWARHLTARHQVLHARTVRGRVRTDSGIAQAAKTALPLIALGQYLAIAGHLAVSGARRLGQRGSSTA